MGGIIMMLALCAFAGSVYLYTKTTKGRKWMNEH